MSEIEKVYYDWSDDHADEKELTEAYAKLSGIISEMIGVQKFNEIDNLIMECVCMERLAAFKGGFQRATAIWKECC